MIKNIIVGLSTWKPRDPTADYAISVAKTFDAHLCGAAISYPPVVAASALEGLPPEFIEAQVIESNKATEAAIACFSNAANAAAVSSETLTFETSVAGAARTFGTLARHFDLAVVCQAAPDARASAELMVEGALFESGHPVVVVPHIQKDGMALERVVVCWDGSRAAARALADALPFLTRAKHVDLVTVSGPGHKPNEHPAVADHLVRHGIKPEFRHLVATDIDVASTLLSYMADAAADFMVMGGYGHSRLREFVLGGVTRSMLRTMTVPTLMSH
jgi:nucleotide-binding universal stress UspA family protein